MFYHAVSVLHDTSPGFQQFIHVPQCQKRGQCEMLLTCQRVSQDRDTVVMLYKVSDRPVQPTPAELNTWEDVRGVAYSESHRGLQCCVARCVHSKCVNCRTFSDGNVTLWLAGGTF